MTLDFYSLVCGVLLKCELLGRISDKIRKVRSTERQRAWKGTTLNKVKGHSLKKN